MVGVHDIVVGDIALLEPGEVVPCDGVFLSGHNVKCDESGATGESDAIRKVTVLFLTERLFDHSSRAIVTGLVRGMPRIVEQETYGEG